MTIIFLLLISTLLGLMLSFIIELIFAEWKEEEKKIRGQGCRCPTKLWFFREISPECPVHYKDFSMQELETYYGEKYMNYPPVTRHRIPVCWDCLKQYMQEDYRLYYFMQVTGTDKPDEEWPDGCYICHKSRLCCMVPKNLIDDWLEGRIFHTLWPPHGKE